MVKKRTRVSQPKNIENAIMEAIIKEIDGEVKKQKQAKTSERSSTYGLMTAIISKHKIANPWLNRDKLNNYKKSKARKKEVIITQNSNSISSITASSDSGIPFAADIDVDALNIMGANDADATTVIEVDAPNTNAAAAAIGTNTATNAIDVDAPDAVLSIVNQGGRPKGSTYENMRELKCTKKLALNYASNEAFRVKQGFLSQGFERIPNVTYKNNVKKVEEKFSLKEGSLNKQTLLTRAKRGNLSASGRGLNSPMLALEAHFLDMILELAAMRQPVTVTDAISLINSMISTSNLWNEIVEWKKKHLPGEFNSDESACLGEKYWQNFKKRQPEIKQKKAVQFDVNREDWCNVDNFQSMYDHLYSAMVRSKVAIELEEEVMVKLDGTITDNEDESTGRKTKYILTHPELVFFVDEVGSNTFQ
jgi:hypothetical protein